MCVNVFIVVQPFIVRLRIRYFIYISYAKQMKIQKKIVCWSEVEALANLLPSLFYAIATISNRTRIQIYGFFFGGVRDLTLFSWLCVHLIKVCVCAKVDYISRTTKKENTFAPLIVCVALFYFILSDRSSSFDKNLLKIIAQVNTPTRSSPRSLTYKNFAL